jgi:hypothetical protein
MLIVQLRLCLHSLAMPCGGLCVDVSSAYSRLFFCHSQTDFIFAIGSRSSHGNRLD